MSIKIKRLKSKQSLLQPVPLTKKVPLIGQVTFTVILILIGVWLTGIYFGYFPIDMAKLHGPIEILLLIGLVIGISGLLLLPSTLTNLLVYTKKASIKFRYPDSPWYWDYNWNPKGDIKNFRSRLVAHLFGVTVVLACLIPGFYLAWTDKKMPLLIQGFIYFFGVLFFLITLYHLIKAFKFKAVSCSYLNFPFRIGEKINVIINGLPRSVSIKDLDIELFCYQYKMVRRGRENRLVSVRLFNKKVEVDKNQIHNNSLALIIDTNDIEKKFTTDFVLDEFIFWELRVSADNPGIDFDYAFLIPLYA